MDPHAHVGGFAEFPLFPKWKWMKGGAGLWLERQQLSTHSPKLRSGLRFHIEIDSKYFNMVIECLPHWDFKEYRANVSPEVVYEFKPFGKKLDLVLHCEIDYYSEKTSQKKTGLTVETIVRHRSVGDTLDATISRAVLVITCHEKETTPNYTPQPITSQNSHAKPQRSRKVSASRTERSASSHAIPNGIAPLMLSDTPA